MDRFKTSLLFPAREMFLLGGCMRCFFAGVLSCAVLGCGSPAVRNSTDDHYQGNASAVERASGPFHSLTGWTETVGFYLDDTAPDEVVEAALHAADSWNEAIGRDVLVFSGVARLLRGEDLYSSLDDLQTVVYYEKNWTATTAKADTTLATTIWESATDSDRIVKGDIILNAQTYVFCDALAATVESHKFSLVVDAQTVLLHEFGHLLGLDHVEIESDAESVMHPKTFIGPRISFRVLSDGDSAHVLSLYDE